MAKCLQNICTNKTEETIREPDSDVQFTSDDSDLESIHDLSEDIYFGVVTNEV
jgi:hypothetical protein